MTIASRTRAPWFVLGVLVLCCAWLIAAPATAQEPAPTLVPPTLVPQPQDAMIDALPSESGVARIQRDAKVRIGILYNEPPFGVLNERGEVSGFDADLARALAEAWGVDLEFVQVTRQTALDMLVAGEVDLLLAALPHMRALDARVEFSQAYYPTDQAMLVREDDSAATLADMANRRVGVVVGTRAEQAVAYWQQRSGIAVTVQTYLTIDQAIVALVNNETDGVVANRIRAVRALTQPGIARFLDEPVMHEPYAIAVRRQDVNLRNLVDKTLQFLEASGKLNDIHRASFNNAAFPNEGWINWANVGDEAPLPAQFGADIPFPTQYVIPRMQGDGSLRVAGLSELPDDAPESDQRMTASGRAIVEAMAGRWGVNVVYVDGGVEQVANGAADLAAGVQADWNLAGQVDFTDAYTMRGEMLMVPANSGINGFADLRSRIVGVFAAEPDAADRVARLAQSQSAIVRNTFSILREQDAAFGMLVDNNYNAVFGDSVRLLPHVQAQPDLLRLIVGSDGQPFWYSRRYLHFAVPRNDIDFRLLVEYTLQELALDGTLASALANVVPGDELPPIDIWPGSSEYLGYNLTFRG
ncbi:MAG: transporter substrate-binding domain-containing protein [Anaerolineae bacterium]|nr:transporter substrate-binding domain-containing protein [Anaerolineae bacterium]